MISHSKGSRLGIPIAIAASLVLAACGSSSSTGKSAAQTAPGGGGSSGGTFRILAISPLSGASSSYGAAQKEALTAAVNLINKHGGFNGAKGVIDIQDDQGSPTQAVSTVQNALASSDKPQLVFPGLTSTETDPLLPILAQANVLNITVAGDSLINDPTKYPLTFEVSPQVKDFGAAMINELKSKGMKSVGVFATNDALGQTDAQGILNAAKATGVTADASYVDPSATDATTPLQQLMSHHPDAVVVDGFGPGLVTLLKAVQLLKVSVPLYGDYATGAQDVVANVGANLTKNLIIQSTGMGVLGTATSTTSQFKQLIRAVKTAGPIKQSFVLYGYAYNCLALAAAGADKAHSTDPVKIAAAIAGDLQPSDAPLYIGPLGWTKRSHVPVFKPNAFVYVPAKPLVDGLFPGATS